MQDSTQSVTPQQAVEIAGGHFNAARFADAEEICRQVLTVEPRNAGALHLLGLVAFQAGQYGQAAGFLAQAVKIDTNNPNYRSNFGLALQKEGKLEEALAQYGEAIGRKPDLAIAHMNRGNILEQQGKPAEAMESYRRAVAADPGYAMAHYNLARALHAKGEIDAAMKSYQQAVALNPAFAEAYTNLGAILKEKGRLDEAIAQHERAIALNPNLAEAHGNLGLALHGQGKYKEAAARHGQAIALNPANAESWYNLGLSLQQQGDLRQAEEQYRKALSLNPRLAKAHAGLGDVFKLEERHDEAAAAYKQALALAPDSADVHYALALVLRAQKKYEEAAASYEQALIRNPDYADAHTNLGAALKELGRFEDAERSHLRAIALQPDLADAHYNLGIALYGQGRYKDAVDAYARAIDLKPDMGGAVHNMGFALQALDRPGEALAFYERALPLLADKSVAHYNIGMVLRAMGRVEEALAQFELAAALDPESPALLSELVHQLQHVCDWEKLVVHEAALLDLVRRRKASLSPFLSLCLSAATPQDQLAAANEVSALSAAPPERMFRHAPGKKEDKIRLGYLSSDLQYHATAFLMAELFEKHDRNRFHITAYSYGKDDGSAMRQRLVSAFDNFVDITAMPHADAARKIYDDGTGILIDLKGHTQGSRLPVPAYRPAPVQVNYLGYPGTIGGKVTDYIIADSFILPFDQQPFYSEKIVHLPGCYQPNDTKREVAETPSRAECGLPEQAFVFACFNQTYKITPEVFGVWMNLLKAVPGSVLWLVEANTLVKKNLGREASSRGIDPSRLIFAPRALMPQHLARQRLADLSLDNLPINAHTTASDALWVGLPLVTCSGSTFVSRVAGSILTAAGLPELVAYNLKDYEALALSLARDPARLKSIRAKLEQTRLQLPLFNIDKYIINLEKAYQAMWQTWQAGEEPKAFSV